MKELLQYRTTGGTVKTCELTLRWPEEMTFTAHGRRRLEAESKAAALACLRFKVGLCRTDTQQMIAEVKSVSKSKSISIVVK